MLAVFILAILALGVLIGARGMRALGRMVRGAWRPGAATLGVLALFAALALAARAQALEAALAGVVGAALLLVASRRRLPARAGAAAVMDRREAESVLGVAPGASPQEIEVAYRRLILRAHPDAGGTTGLARRLTEAREALQTSRP